MILGMGQLGGHEERCKLVHYDDDPVEVYFGVLKPAACIWRLQFCCTAGGWLGDVVIRRADSRLSVVGSNPGLSNACLFLRQVTVFGR